MEDRYLHERRRELDDYMTYTPLCPIRASSIQTKAANYTAVVTDGIILVDASGGPVTITLYSGANIGNTLFLAIKKIDSSGNAVTIDGEGSETIDDAASVSLTTQHEIVRLIPDGTNWRKI